MDDVLLVHVAEGQQELLDRIGCPTLIQSFHLNDMIVEFTTSNELCNDVEIRLIL